MNIELLVHFEKSLLLTFERRSSKLGGRKEARKMSIVQRNTNRMMHLSSSGYIGNTNTVKTCLQSGTVSL